MRTSHCLKMEEIIDMEIKHWHHLNDEEENRLNRLLIGGYINNRQLIRYKDTKFAISENYLPMAERIRSFEVRNEDIWLMNFAKTGITWTSEIVWQIDRGIGADCDGKNIMQKCPFIESDMVNINLKGEIFSPFGKKGDYRRNEIFNRLDQMEERRIIKTHLPFCLLNPDLLDKTKVIYVARDPKDVCVSYFRFFDMMSHFLGKIQQGFDEYVECFKAGLGWCGDFWYHVHVSKVYVCMLLNRAIVGPSKSVLPGTQIFLANFLQLFNIIAPFWNIMVDFPAISLLQFLWWVDSSKFSPHHPQSPSLCITEVFGNTGFINAVKSRN